MKSRVVETVISAILRGGVAISITIVAIGIAISFVHHRDYFSSRPALGKLIDPRAEYTASLSSVIKGAREGRGQSIVMIGILVLIATPVVRVATSIILFAVERDFLYAGITSVVLLLLLMSFAIGAAG